VVKQQLDFGDIFNQIEKQKATEPGDQEAAETINTTKLKKQLKNLKRDPSKQLATPLAGVKKQKIMREQAQQMNSKIVSKYIPQVKANREAV